MFSDSTASLGESARISTSSYWMGREETTETSKGKVIVPSRKRRSIYCENSVYQNSQPISKIKTHLNKNYTSKASCPQQQPQHGSLIPYAPNVAPSTNQTKVVVAVAEVLGSKTAEVLVTQNLITRGTRASRPAKHDCSLRQPAVNSQTLPNS